MLSKLKKNNETLKIDYIKDFNQYEKYKKDFDYRNPKSLNVYINNDNKQVF